MNAPVIGTPSTDPHDPWGITTHATDRLIEAAMAGEIALSDRAGVVAFLHRERGHMRGKDRNAIRRRAMDAVQHDARFGAHLAKACVAALARAERAAEGSRDSDPHAVLAEITDMIAGALAEHIGSGLTLGRKLS